MTLGRRPRAPRRRVVRDVKFNVRDLTRALSAAWQVAAVAHWHAMPAPRRAKRPLRRLTLSFDAQTGLPTFKLPAVRAAPFEDRVLELTLTGFGEREGSFDAQTRFARLSSRGHHLKTKAQCLKFQSGSLRTSLKTTCAARMPKHGAAGGAADDAGDAVTSAAASALQPDGEAPSPSCPAPSVAGGPALARRATALLPFPGSG